MTCGDCHRIQQQALAESVHPPAGVDCRTCHGGDLVYTTTRPWMDVSDRKFDHGPHFKGKPPRRAIPELCGNCHADVSRMNPYGLPTDQLAQYRTSGHGRALFERGDERAAVCSDCHDAHAVLDPQSPASPVYPTNVPDLCGRCHENPEIMADSGLSLTVVEEYRQSVHGQGLLEKGDTGMPTCAVCHGSHSAVPPGYQDVGHICGRCHQQEERHFLESHHAGFPLFPRCVGCHSADREGKDHRIARVTASPEALREAYQETRAAVRDVPIDSAAFLEAFENRREPRLRLLSVYCDRCHNVSKRPADGTLFSELDRLVAPMAEELHATIRMAEIRYADAAERVQQVGRGELLVDDEAMLVEEMRTTLVGLGPLLHELRSGKLKEAAGELETTADQLHASLDDKLRGLRWRYWTLIPMWAFALLFSSALWVKYKRLKDAMVKTGERSIKEV